MATRGSKGFWSGPTVTGLITDIPKLFEAVEKAGKAGDVKQLALAQTGLLQTSYQVAIRQATASFWVALITAVVGIALYLLAASFAVLWGRDAAVIGAVGATTVEIVSALAFVLYEKARSQLGEFSKRLDQVQRCLLAVSVIDSMDDRKMRDEARTHLAQSIVGAV